MREGGFPDCALEQEHLIGEIDRIAVQQINFQLRRAAFLNNRVDFQVLALGEIINVVDDFVVLIDRAEAVSLPSRAFAARAARRRF